jgi:SulP family sulfate permease
MLVALPASLAFGVSVYTAIGPQYAGQGALAGLAGAVVMGIVAPWLGGTQRLVSAPCAPAAAVLSALALQMARGGDDPQVIILLLILVGALGGIIQIVFGLVGLGRLIRYIPYPVVSGYLTGVGLIIIAGQASRILGTAPELGWYAALAAPGQWDWRSLLIAGATLAGATLAPRWTRAAPGTVFGIAAGVATYFVLALADPRLLSLVDNPLVVGSLSASGHGLSNRLFGPWPSLAGFDAAHFAALLGNAVILAALLSIDTLKTCVVLDKLTRSRHDSDRELRAQGAANLATAACGGVAGAGTMGATLVALNSGAVTRMAGLLVGVFTLLAALTVGALLAWIPVAALAGILVTIGVRMIDREALRYARSTATILDFCVVLTVIVVAISVGLIMASAVGVGLSMILFVREQSGGSPVRFKLLLGETSSTWHRPEAEMAYLAARTDDGVVFGLQGALFFGNTYRLYSDLEQEIRTRRFVVIDLRRVPSIDVTAIQIFLQIREALHERGATLVLCGLRGRSRRARNPAYLLDRLAPRETGDETVVVQADLDSAIAWVESRLLAEMQGRHEATTALTVQEMDLFTGYRDDTLSDLEAHMLVRSYAAGETIYARGSAGDELYWVRRGAVCLMSAAGTDAARQVAGFGPGDFFGGLSFLDGRQRPNHAVAMTDVEVYVLTRAAFAEIAAVHKKLAFNLASAMARTLAKRLRRAEKKLVALGD